MLRRREGIDSQAGRIIVGPGSKELLFQLQMARDCELLLPAPSWVSYAPQSLLLAQRTRWIVTRAENGWKLTAQDLDRHCNSCGNPATRLLILNSPNNPSGACYSEAELQDLARIAAKHSLLIVSDEIYSELHFRGQHRSMARYYPQGTIISNGISKWAGAGGWRLGFMAFPPSLQALLKSMIVIASETFSSVSAPIQMASICAFEDSPAMIGYIQACRHIMSALATDFCARLRHAGVDVVEPEGGFYCLADFSPLAERLQGDGMADAATLATRLLEETGVATLPGDDFGLSGSLILRLALVDFDGAGLLQRVLDEPQLAVNLDLPELESLRQAVEGIGDWLPSA
jgi:aspartate aminotransferase